MFRTNLVTINSIIAILGVLAMSCARAEAPGGSAELRRTDNDPHGRPWRPSSADAGTVADSGPAGSSEDSAAPAPADSGPIAWLVDSGPTIGLPEDDAGPIVLLVDSGPTIRSPENDSGALAPLFAQDFESTTLAPTWAEGSTHGGLLVNFTGFGSVSVATAGSRVLRIAPAASSVLSETHASLLTSTLRFGDLDFGLRMRTTAQLRVGSPNTWEVGWVIWHYGGNQEFYYFLLKPNGWELGKADPAYPGAQRFLATGSTVIDPLAWHDIRVVHRGTTMSIDVDGHRIVDFTDSERPYTGGAVGLYSEDAEVEFDDLRVTTP